MRENNFAIKEIYCVPTPKFPWPQLGFQLGAIHTQKGYLGDIKMSYSPSMWYRNSKKFINHSYEYLKYTHLISGLLPRVPLVALAQ